MFDERHDVVFEMIFTATAQSFNDVRPDSIMCGAVRAGGSANFQIVRVFFMREFECASNECLCLIGPIGQRVARIGEGEADKAGSGQTAPHQKERQQSFYLITVLQNEKMRLVSAGITDKPAPFRRMVHRSSGVRVDESVPFGIFPWQDGV